MLPARASGKGITITEKARTLTKQAVTASIESLGR
jgi:hypothetical protein